MKRIAVIGCGGSGKTTLAHRLANIYNLPVRHLDLYAYGPNWRPVTEEAFHIRHEALIKEDEWIIDGMMHAHLPQRLDRAQMVIYLDFPSWQNISGALSRLVNEYGSKRTDTPEGCLETFDWPFFLYLLSFSRKVRPHILPVLENAPAGTQVKIFKSRGELNRWLQNLENASSD
jgi:adenylate kinase family enzyme